jgi:uncharacterized protein (TIGR00730 family)
VGRAWIKLKRAADGNMFRVVANRQPHFAAHNQGLGREGMHVDTHDGERWPVTRDDFVVALCLQIGFELLKIVIHRETANLSQFGVLVNNRRGVFAYSTMAPMLKRVCVFCGSSSGVNLSYQQAAQSVGRLFAQRGIVLVYGGGNVGLMGILANACLNEGGRVIGVIPGALADKELAHIGLTELRIVNSMHERKSVMADLSDAFIALPGGYGTLEELFEALSWSQLGIQRKACGILNVDGYYDPLLEMADRAVAEGFLRAAHRELLLSDVDPERLLNRLSTNAVPAAEKWIDRPEG